MNYIYILTYLGGCLNGVCLNTCLCSEKIKVDSDNEENDELENRWNNSRLYINYLENILHNISPRRRSSIPLEFPENIQTVNAEVTNSGSPSAPMAEVTNSGSPSAPLAEASILRD